MTPVNERANILANEQVGPNLYIMEVASPLITGGIEPGQFVHMKIPGMEGHILRRPFSVYATIPEIGALEILYQVVGFGTERMVSLGLGDTVELIGPVGRRWQAPEGAKRALLIGGGVGAAPLFMLADDLRGQDVELDVILGAQTKDALVCRPRYEDLAGCATSCATDDGSFGHAGFCTTLVEKALAANAYDYAAVCGPEPMMKIVAGLLKEAQVPSQVSFEKRMACGIGACLSCVVETTDGNKRACVDGPIFDVEKVVF